jgi:hypothetical protein
MGRMEILRPREWWDTTSVPRIAVARAMRFAELPRAAEALPLRHAT